MHDGLLVDVLYGGQDTRGAALLPANDWKLKRTL
jgi:hypothetical protein